MCHCLSLAESFKCREGKVEAPKVDDLLAKLIPSAELRQRLKYFGRDRRLKLGTLCSMTKHR